MLATVYTVVRDRTTQYFYSKLRARQISHVSTQRVLNSAIRHEKETVGIRLNKNKKKKNPVIPEVIICF